jgi:NADH:ubiquinone oxidoreductase subunit 6 (subunit J)
LPVDKLARFVQDFWPILLPTIVGAAAVYLLLPRARRYPPLWGGLAAGVTLVLAGALLIHNDFVPAEAVLFYAFSGTAVVSGCLLVTQHNPVYAALSFALVVLSTCGLFLLQAAPFLMAATIIIYAGAIIVTFLFVIMLAQQEGPSSADQRSREPLLATVSGFVLLGALLCVLQRTYDTSALDTSALRHLDEALARIEHAIQSGSAEEIGKLSAPEEGGKNFFDSLRNALADEPRWPPQTKEVRETLINDITDIDAAQPDLTNPKALAARIKALRDLHEEGISVRNAVADQYALRDALHGNLQPDKQLPLSKFSGPPPSEPPQRDAQGRVQGSPLPAENVASLGRSLFTDYLLAVELAGTLLMVATIGAIAIAGRRAEGLR